MLIPVGLIIGQAPSLREGVAQVAQLPQQIWDWYREEGVPDIRLVSVAHASDLQIISPNTAVIWQANTINMVQWSAPASCTTVDIRLSTNGGDTYDIVLALNVSNSGSQAVLLPNVNTSTARILVRCINTHHTGYSETNFTIQQGGAQTLTISAAMSGSGRSSGRPGR